MLHHHIIRIITDGIVAERTVALDDARLSVACPSRFTPADGALITRSIGGWVDRRTGPDDVRNKYIGPDKIRTKIIQSSGL
jgi:hypothetical protein